MTVTNNLSHARCTNCAGQECFDFARALPSGTVVDYWYECDECHRRIHVDGSGGPYGLLRGVVGRGAPILSFGCSRPDPPRRRWWSRS